MIPSLSAQPEQKSLPKPRREPLSWDEKLLIFGFPGLLVLAAIGQLSLTRSQPAVLIAYPAPVALPNPNGFDAYLSAEAAIKLDVPAVDPIDDSLKLMPTDAKSRAKKYSLGNKIAWLRANAGGFSLFRAAQTLPCRHPVAMPSGFFFAGSNYARHNRLRQLARYKAIEINALKLQKKWGGAVNSALDTIQMGNDIAVGGALDAKYTGLEIETTGRDHLTAPDDPISKLSAPEARGAARRLQTIITHRFPFAQTLENSRWAALQEFDMVSRLPNWQSQMAANQGREATWREKMGLIANPRPEIVADIKRIYDANTADLKKPYSAPYSALAPLNLLSQNFVWGQSQRFDQTREKVTLNVLLLRLALRAFEAQNGRFPAQLGELSPRFIGKIPTDDFADGKPFHYSVSGKTYRLYSVGPDGKDDKGTPLKENYGRLGRNGFGRYESLQSGKRGDYVAGINP